MTFGKTRSQGAAGHYHVVYQYEQEDVGLEAGQLGVTLLHALLPPALRPEGSVPAGFDFAAERDEFIRFAQRRALGPSTMSLVRAAEERRIPWIRLNEQSLIQFGHGRFQQRIRAALSLALQALLCKTPRPLADRDRTDLQPFGYLLDRFSLAAQQNNAGSKTVPLRGTGGSDASLQFGPFFEFQFQNFNGACHAAEHSTLSQLNKPISIT